MAFGGALLSLLGKVVNYSWLLVLYGRCVVWVLAPSSHLGCHLLGHFEILQSDHFWVSYFDLLILHASIFSLYLLELLVLIQIFDDFQKLLPLFFVYPWKVSFFDGLFYESFHFFLLLQGHLFLFCLLVVVCSLYLIAWFIFGLNFLLLHLNHPFVVLQPLSSLAIFLSLHLFILLFVLLNCLGVDCFEHGMSFAHYFFPVLELRLLVSMVVALLEFLE